MMDPVSNPALQRILQNLNGFQPQSSVQFQKSYGNVLPGLGLLQSEPTSVSTSLAPPPVEPRSRPATPTPDASTITAWPAALKHITKHIVPNEKYSAKIKHLIAEQHKHERQWWAGRESIVSKQKGRAESQQRAAELLKSLGGIAGPVLTASVEVDEAELRTYDKKVYGELVKMAAEFDRQLRSMGVPFYAIKHELVILEEGKVKLGSRGRLDKGELRELQKRMLQTLEDLFME